MRYQKMKELLEHETPYKDDMSIYGDMQRQDLIENDEIEPWEEGFMRGYEEIEA